MTPRERERAAWLGSLIGIAELTGRTVVEAAAKAGPPPYAQPGDGEAELIASLAAEMDATPPGGVDDGLRDLARAVEAMNGRDADEARDELAALPLAAVLFLAVVGTLGERAEVDPPLILILAAIRETIEGWARVPSLSPAYAHVPLGELERLACRVGAAIEVARRSIGKTAAGIPSGKRCQFAIIDADARARVCGKPATSTCAVDGVDLRVCDVCATWIATQGRGPKVWREEPPR